VYLTHADTCLFGDQAVFKCHENAILTGDNNHMKKTQDEKRKPSQKPTTTHPKGIRTISKEIWEKALAKTRRKEARDAGPAVLWLPND